MLFKVAQVKNPVITPIRNCAYCQGQSAQWLKVCYHIAQLIERSLAQATFSIKTFLGGLLEGSLFYDLMTAWRNCTRD